jgi:NADP-dependent 3-hydroxy acid dehydrogenase YdfG
MLFFASFRRDRHLSAPAESGWHDAAKRRTSRHTLKEMQMGILDGQVAWVTGAGSGIGLAGALELAAGGATVALSGRRLEPLQAAAGKIHAAGGRAEAIQLDVADQKSVAAAAQAILGRHGHIDILVNSAGVNVPQRHWKEVSTESFDRVFAVNLNGAFYAIAAVLPGMRSMQRGTIVNISSWAGRFENKLTGPAYSASKRAMISLNHSINVEECTNGIRACAICPGEVATPILKSRPVPPSAAEMARMLQPEDLGRTIRFVCELPPHACINEILMSPTWNRLYAGG